MASREWLSEISSPRVWSEVSPPPLPLSRELLQYQSEVVSLERITSPADATIAYIALRSLGDAQSHPLVPRAWERLFDRLLEIEPTRRQELASLVAEAVRQIFGLHTPEEIGGITDGGETASSTHVEENAFSQTTLHMLNDLEILVLGMLDIPARCNFAQTCRGNRAVVQTWRKREIETIFSNEKLRRLFPFFFIHAPYVLHPESFDLWPSEWASRTLPAIIQQITRTQLLLDSEKKSLLRFSDPKAAKDFDAIKKLLQASYDISLVTAFEEVMCPWISGQSTMFLSEKVTAAKAFFQQLDDSYVGFHIAPDAARPCSCMTCVPEEIFLQVPLCTLHFSKSSILTIPESLRFSSKLKHLVLSHNKLIDVPDFIGRMSQLVTITLSYNQIKTLPKSFGSLINLEELDLSGNPIESLPDSFQSLTKLQTLQLLQVNLDASFCHKLPPGLNVFIDSKHRFHPINMYKTFPRHVQIHYGAKEK